MLLVHWTRRADSRAACTAGRSRPIRTAMTVMTTSSSIRVNPRRGSRLMLRKPPSGWTGDAAVPLRRGLLALSGVRDRRCRRQDEGRPRPATDVALDADPTPMGLGDRTAD